MHTNLVVLHWLPPEGSDFSEYVVRYRTDASPWQRISGLHDSEARIEDMHYGERYLIQVNTVSFGVESPQPLELNVTMPPQPVSNVVPLVDSHNLTLEWPQPDGHVDFYTLKWWPTDEPNNWEVKNVSHLEQKDCKDVSLRSHPSHTHAILSFQQRHLRTFECPSRTCRQVGSIASKSRPVRTTSAPGSPISPRAPCP